jgi:hypothetical protein
MNETQVVISGEPGATAVDNRRVNLRTNGGYRHVAGQQTQKRAVAAPIIERSTALHFSRDSECGSEAPAMAP